MKNTPNTNGPKKKPAVAKAVLDLDYKIRMLAIYDVSKGNTEVAHPNAIWRRFRMFKRHLRSGEFDFAWLEEQIMSRWSGKSPRNERADMDVIDALLKSVGLEGEAVGADI